MLSFGKGPAIQPGQKIHRTDPEPPKIRMISTPGGCAIPTAILVLSAIILIVFVFTSCAEPEPDWPTTLAIQSTHPNTTWRVVIIGDVTQDETVVPIPDYATEVIIIREGAGAVIAHMSPELRDYTLSRDQDSLRIPIR